MEIRGNSDYTIQAQEIVMNRFIYLALSLIIILSLVGCTGGLTRIAFIDWVDFIKFNGITYIHQYENVSLKESDLSPYAEIKFKIDGNVNNPDYQSRDGDAAYLETGTPVYSLSGYSPNFRLVVRKDDKLPIYEADTNHNAKSGNDLMDIEGKVEYFSINSREDGKTELATIKDKTQVNELVRMILEAPVDQDSSKTGSEQYFLEFHLKDGTTTKKCYWLDTGLLSRGIQLPEDFGASIQSALNEQVK
jgi:hypothetical protein